MPTEHGSVPAEIDPRRVGAFQRLLRWAQALEAAVDVSYDDVQDRRILALERDVASLRQAIDPPPPGVLVVRADTVRRG